MSRGALVRLLLVLGLLAGCAAIALSIEPKLGLDLRGGASFTLEAKDTPTVKADAEATDKALEVLRGRVDSLGVSEPTLVRAGENRIIVELPDVQDPAEAVAVLGKTAQLSVHPVVAVAAGPDAKPSKKGNEVLPTDQGDFIEIAPPVLQGDEITGAAAEQPENRADWAVTVDFSGEGSAAFGDLSAKAACATDASNRIAIVLDGKVISSPGVQVACGSRIENSTQITGDFTFAEADDLAVLIEGGALPVPVEIISQSVVGPTLGEAAIDASIEAAIIGLILTGLFIGIVYRFVGALATIALASYALLSYAFLVALGSTLTLPGLAGFVLAIGMAIDANVLVFERAREEYAEHPSMGMRRALSVGFNKAWTAIIDSNVTTLLAAGLLFLLAAGPVKGFGVTLSIGVVASMISALVVARVLTEVGVALPWVRKRPAFTGLASVGRVRTWLTKRNPDLMGKSRIWLGISGVALVLALAGIFGSGMNLGVEFTGGRVVAYTPTQDVSADTAREAIADAGFPEATVQESEGDIVVRTGKISNEEQVTIEQALAEVSGGVTKQRDESIGASLGDELRNKALLAFGIALIVQMLYLAIRFKWTFGLAAVTAMFHDVLIVVGIFAWWDKPIDGVFLAAVMTIIGLSVNDTVVVFDRIRERWRLSRDEKFADVANTACLETMPRTINTGLGTMFILGALAILGGASLGDFSIALLLGLAIGTYSSVFTATPLVILMQKRWPMSRATKVKTVRDPEDSGAVI